MKSSTIPLPFQIKETVRCAASLSLALGLLFESSSCSSNKTAAPERSETPAAVPTETLRIPRVATIQAAGDGSVSKVENGWKVVAKGGATFAAAVPLWSYGSGQWAGTVEAHLRVTKGKIGLGLLTTDYHILKEQTVAASPDTQNVSLPVASTESGKALLLRGLEPSEAFVEAVDLALPAAKLPNAVSLAKITGTLVEPGPPVHVVTAAGAWSYAAALPLALDNSQGTLFLRVKATALRGEPYFGILNRDQKDFQSQGLLPPGPNAQDVIVYIPSPATAGSVIVRNGGKTGVSELRIEDMAVYAVK
jgi:hypothetical protein